ncbi:MAG: hypothetical protein ACSLEM_05295 [Candidatus Malihini olakiniferum]
MKKIAIIIAGSLLLAIATSQAISFSGEAGAIMLTQALAFWVLQA